MTTCTRDGDRRVIEPVRKRELVAWLKTMKPQEQDFSEIGDPVPAPEGVRLLLADHYLRHRAQTGAG